MSPEEWNVEMDGIWLEPQAVYWMRLQLANGIEATVLVKERRLYNASSVPTIQIEAHDQLGAGVPLVNVRRIVDSHQQ